MKTHRYTEDSTPSEDPKTGPRKTLAKNAKNVMFYHLRGVRAPRTSTDFQPYLIYEDIRVLGSISKASGCVCGGGWCVWGGWCFFNVFYDYISLLNMIEPKLKIRNQVDPNAIRLYIFYNTLISDCPSLHSTTLLHNVKLRLWIEFLCSSYIAITINCSMSSCRHHFDGLGYKFLYCFWHLHYLANLLSTKE